MKQITVLAAMFIAAVTTAQTTVKSTSFEEPLAGAQYVDTGDANVAHDLLNNAGESMVDFTTVGNEIGFDATYTPYDTPDVGLTDGDFVGASTFTGDVTAYTDGLQGYQLSDIDGNMILTFDPVDFTGFENNTVSIDYFVNGTGYEGDGTLNESGSDRMRIYVRDLTNNTEIDILNTEGSDINDLMIEDTWITGTASVPNDAMVQVVVEVRTNSGSETLYLDKLLFQGNMAAPTSNLIISEIFSGQAGTDLTADWFEITNTGTGAWISGVDADLYYDDESASGSDADLIEGITEIQPGATVIVLVTGDVNDITTFNNVWSPVIDLTGIEIGYTDGAGLGGGGDDVNIWLGDPLTTSPIYTASYPDTGANDGQSFDVELAAFSTVGNANGAVETIAQGGSSNDVPNIGSPGNGPATTQATVLFDGNFIAVSEADGNVTIGLIPSAAPTIEGSIDVTIVAGGSAIEGTDFTYASSETVIFPIGSTDMQTINIPILDNSVDGSDVFFVLQLENEINTVIGGDNVFSVYILDDDTLVPAGDAAEIGLTHLTSYLVDPAGTAEISAFDPASQQLFVTNGDKIEVLDFTDPLNITSVTTIDVATFGAASIQSIAVSNGLIAGALSVDPATDNGLVVISNADGSSTVTLEVGSLPDMLTFSPDGTKLLVANEGQPSDDYTIDPEGSVSVIDVSGGLGNISQADVTTLNFNAFDAQQATLEAAGVRIYGPGATVSQDLEPEYIAVSNDSQKAYVTLQENNAYAIIDLNTLTITDIFSFGLKDHSLAGNTIDVSDETDFIFDANWPIKGMYMPDALAFYEVAGTSYIVTANEGDAREYGGFEEERKIGDSDYTLDPSVFTNVDMLALASNLGEIGVTSASGDIDNDGDYDEIHVFGGRSFSIFNAETGELVYDSGNDFEVITANDPIYGAIFNASNSNNNPKNRSDNKGPEPEGVTIREIQGQTYAFILLERIGGVMVYNITDPAAPVFVEYENNRDATPGGNEMGDLGPEGVIYIAAEDNSTERGVLIVSNEVSATLGVYTIEADIILGVNDYNFESTTFVMYPNPAKGQVFFNVVDDYKMYDLSGRFIKEEKNTEVLTINEIPSGIYFIVNAQGSTQKLIVK